MLATRIVSLFFIALAAVVLWNIQNLDYWSMDGPGPRLLPFWVSIVMIMSALWLLLRPGSAGENQSPARLRQVVGYVGLLAVAIVIFATVGALAAILVFIVAELVLIERRSIVRSLALGVVCTAAIYAVFVLLLHMQLPGYVPSL